MHAWHPCDCDGWHVQLCPPKSYVVDPDWFAHVWYVFVLPLQGLVWQVIGVLSLVQLTIVNVSVAMQPRANVSRKRIVPS